MKGTIILSLALLAAPGAAFADQLIPAGTIIQCTIGESGKISSQTEKVGDPVMCQLSHSERYGRTSFPYGSYLIGRFAEYKDPGHLVGKGWMELKFDRLVVQPDTIVPIQARVVEVPKYPVDQEGRIHGTGHATRDTITWLIPVLWPIDLINLPRRGPRPTLGPETKLTLKVLDDFGIPTPQENAVRTPALVSRQTPDEPTYQSMREPAPIQRAYAQEQPVQQNYAPPQQNYAPPQQNYAPQQAYSQPASQPVQQAYNGPQTVIYQLAAPQPVIIQQQQPVIIQQQQPMVVQQPVPYPVPYPAYAYRPRYYGPY